MVLLIIFLISNFHSYIFKIFLCLIVASEAKRPYKNDENFLNNWLPDHHKLYLINFYKSWARPGGGSVQILCYRTPPRPLGISKRHFTGRKMVVWGWFMSIFINLYRLGTSQWPFLIFTSIRIPRGLRMEQTDLFGI